MRVYIIYRERIMGWWIVGALWGTPFTILRTPFMIAQASVDAADASWMTTQTKAVTEATRAPAKT